MVEEATTYGSIETPNAVRQRLARDSGAENLRNEKFVELFPDLVNEINAKLEKRRAQAKPVKKVENEPETSPATNARTNLRAVNNQQSDNGLSNMAIFAMITLLVLSVSAVSYLKSSRIKTFSLDSLWRKLANYPVSFMSRPLQFLTKKLKTNIVF